MLPLPSSCETENVILVGGVAQVSVVDKHGSTTVRMKELRPVKAVTKTPFRNIWLIAMVYTPTPESSMKVGVV